MTICGELASRCSVSMTETAWCSLIWALEYIFIPLTIIIIVFYILKKIRREKTK
jgi:hypothetical protein